MLLAYLPTHLFPLAAYGVKYKCINRLMCKRKTFIVMRQT